MNGQQYVDLAKRTESVPENFYLNRPAFLALLELTINSANIADLFKKKLFYNKAIDLEKFQQYIYGVTAALGVFQNIDFTLTPDEAIGGNLNKRLMHCALGINTESGEMLEALLKQFQTGVLDKVNFSEEMGDVDWYMAIGTDETGVDEEVRRKANIDKLAKRFGDKFSDYNANNRDLAAERIVLETQLQKDAKEMQLQKDAISLAQDLNAKAVAGAADLAEAINKEIGEVVVVNSGNVGSVEDVLGGGVRAGGTNVQPDNFVKSLGKTKASKT